MPVLEHPDITLTVIESADGDAGLIVGNGNRRKRAGENALDLEDLANFAGDQIEAVEGGVPRESLGNIENRLIGDSPVAFHLYFGQFRDDRLLSAEEILLPEGIRPSEEEEAMVC